MIPAENGQCYPFKIYPTPYGENLCPRFLFVLGNISLESWASLERAVRHDFYDQSKQPWINVQPSIISYEGCDRQRKGREIMYREGFLSFVHSHRLSLIFDRLQDASTCIRYWRTNAILVNISSNFSFLFLSNYSISILKNLLLLYIYMKFNVIILNNNNITFFKM